VFTLQKLIDIERWIALAAFHGSSLKMDLVHSLSRTCNPGVPLSRGAGEFCLGDACDRPAAKFDAFAGPLTDTDPMLTIADCSRLIPFRLLSCHLSIARTYPSRFPCPGKLLLIVDPISSRLIASCVEYYFTRYEMLSVLLLECPVIFCAAKMTRCLPSA
jgi:hypothetical protein